MTEDDAIAAFLSAPIEVMETLDAPVPKLVPPHILPLLENRADVSVPMHDEATHSDDSAGSSKDDDFFQSVWCCAAGEKTSAFPVPETEPCKDTVPKGDYFAAPAYEGLPESLGSYVMPAESSDTLLVDMNFVLDILPLLGSRHSDAFRAAQIYVYDMANLASDVDILQTAEFLKMTIPKHLQVFRYLFVKYRAIISQQTQ